VTDILADIRAEIKRLGASPIYHRSADTLNSVATILSRAPLEKWPRIAASAYQLHPGVFSQCQAVVASQYIKVLCPAYPKVSRSCQARITLGEKPVDVLPGLTAKEANDALTIGFITPLPYLLRNITKAMGNGCTVRSLHVARWLDACANDPARMTAIARPSTRRGEEEWGMYYERLDEIQDTDLSNGIDTGVSVAFANARERVRLFEAANPVEPETPSSEKEVRTAPVPDWWKPIRCATLLNHPAQLRQEGLIMHHCVSSYGSAVSQRLSVIVSITVRDFKTMGANGIVRRSTAELSWDGKRIVQHKGAFNATPHVLCQLALNVCMRRWRKHEFRKTTITR
jgi:hypothetical protein